MPTAKTLQTPPIGLTRRPLDDMRSPAYHFDLLNFSQTKPNRRNKKARPEQIIV